MANARQVGPAHAGMDPTSPSRPPPSGGLPRTRGDGPPLIIAKAPDAPAPPHTRGWTR